MTAVEEYDILCILQKCRWRLFSEGLFGLFCVPSRFKNPADYYYNICSGIRSSNWAAPSVCLIHLADTDKQRHPHLEPQAPCVYLKYPPTIQPSTSHQGTQHEHLLDPIPLFSILHLLSSKPYFHSYTRCSIKVPDHQSSDHCTLTPSDSASQPLSIISAPHLPINSLTSHLIITLLRDLGGSCKEHELNCS